MSKNVYSSQNYLTTNVFEEALNRIRFVFDNCDDVIVSMSGGKDSTVIFNLAMIVAKERGRLPLKVFWLDQEAEWDATGKYMNYIMRRKDVKPYWFQIPFDFTNSLSFENNYLRVWDEEKKDIWIRPQSDISIKVNPTDKNRFHDLIEVLPSYCDVEDKQHVGVLVGMRISENTVRRMTICYTKSQYKGITWCRKNIKNTRVFYPIYDFNDTDIWTAIARNKWKYNTIYDSFYRYGISGKDMRVSALIHETAWHSIERLQEVEPNIYNRYLDRVNGVNCFSQFGKDIMIKELPATFKDWKEYRDYLLKAFIKPEYWELFQNRWKNQDGERWYKCHVNEIMVNDIDGTINTNMRSRFKVIKRTENNYYVNKEAKKREKATRK